LGLADDATAADVDVDVHGVRVVACEVQRFLDLQAAELRRVDLERDVVDADAALALARGGAGDRGLALAADVHDLGRHALTSPGRTWRPACARPGPASWSAARWSAPSR